MEGGYRICPFHNLMIHLHHTTHLQGRSWESFDVARSMIQCRATSLGIAITMMTSSDTNRISAKGSRLAAGLGLIVMAIIAGMANFGILEHNVVAGDASASASNLIANEGAFRLAALLFLCIAVLDVVVAWALNEVFREVSPSLSALAAAFRYVYAGILAIATTFLILAVQRTSKASSVEDVDLTFLQTHLDAFSDMWDIGLILFACHLLVVGLVIVRSGSAKAGVGLGWLVIIAGAGYLFDGVMFILGIDPGFEAAMFAFIGEVALMGWLIYEGFRIQKSR